MGSPRPTASNIDASALANSEPEHEAERPTRPTPITSASSATAPRICARVAPSVRSSANSRVRSATVIVNVLKMMNAPTSSAAPANASSAGVRKPPIWSLMSAAVSSAAVVAGAHLELGAAAQRRMRRTSSSGATPSSAATLIVVTSPSRSNQRWMSASGAETTSVPPAFALPRS